MFAIGCAAFVILVLLFGIVRGLYRLTFHPLTKFPGPRLAAFSQLYECYFHTSGAWEAQIQYIHTTYASPIVRIGPNEVHVNDPEYYDTIFCFNPHLDKKKYCQDNLQHTASHAQHKLRRHGLESFFSRANIVSLESVIRENVGKLCAQLNAAKESSSPTKISLLYRCLTADFITEYCFGRNLGFLNNPEAAKPFFGSFYDGFKLAWLMREFKPYERLLAWIPKLPSALLPSRDSRTGAFLHIMQDVEKDVQRAVSRDIKEGDRKTIFTELPRNEKLPPSEKTADIIYSTAILLIAAGLETTAHALETATFHLNVPENSATLKKAKEEIVEVWPNAEAETPDWKALDKLPYLQAIIKESLRMSLGVSARLSRINHHEAMAYKNWTIPKGYEISMSQFDVQYNEDIFPDPWAFRPDRWLGKEGKLREKHLVAFSRGSRGCIGIHLAMAELNTTLATVIRRYDFRLFETDRRDVDYKYDYFVPYAETGEKGVSVEVL